MYFKDFKISELGWKKRRRKGEDFLFIVIKENQKNRNKDMKNLTLHI